MSKRPSNISTGRKASALFLVILENDKLNYYEIREEMDLTIHHLTE